MLKHISHIFQKTIGETLSDLLQSRYAKQLILVFSIQAFSLFTSFSISLIITNLLGAASYGVFSYSFSWVNLLAVLSCLGLEQLAIKELPNYQVLNRNDLIRGYFKYALRRVIITSFIVSLSLFCYSFFLNQPPDHSLQKGLWFALPILPVIAVINLRSAWLRGYHFNSLSQVPDKVLRPLLFLVLLAVYYFFIPDQLNIYAVIVISMVSILAALLAGNVFISRRILPEVTDIAPAYDQAYWLKISFLLFLVNGAYFYLSQIQILMLGSLSGAKETGIFSIASRLSDLEGYLLAAMNVVLAPLISKLFAERNMKELQALVTKSLRIGFFFSAPVVILFLLFPAFFLHLFGDDFAAGTFVLILLTVSQVVNFATGSVGYLLTMTGHQKTAVQILLFCALVTTLLSFILIPVLGINGAAISAATNNILLNVLMAIAVYRKIGINSTLLRIR
ncbi:MAG: oligosaccharide flippase family protein [Chitinophagales bacterium]|nr:oligosaccharide flippase family protein [Chitinophagales bacterium]